MKKKRTVSKNEEKKLKKWQIAALCSLIGAAVLIVAMSLVLPLVKINGDLDELVDKMTENGEAQITITDMDAENVFGGEKGETSLVSEDLLEKLDEVADDMRYKGKETESLGAWDIRFRANGGELYLTESGVYYTSGNVKYRFVPRDEEAVKEYESFYKEIESLLK